MNRIKITNIIENINPRTDEAIDIFLLCKVFSMMTLDKNNKLLPGKKPIN